MSNPCLVVESIADADSSCPVTDIVAVFREDGIGRSSVRIGFSPLLTISGNAATQTFLNAFAILVNAAVSDTDVTESYADVNVGVNESASARSRLFSIIAESVTSTGNGSVFVSYDSPVLVLSIAQTTSSLVSSDITHVVDDEAKAVVFVLSSSSESVLAQAAATTVITSIRHVEQVEVVEANGSTNVEVSAIRRLLRLDSSSEAFSEVVNNLDSQNLVESVAEVLCNVWFKNPDKIAWVMNTETSAVSWYNNFDFESIAQPPGRTLAVGVGGLYELTGALDQSDEIDAEVVSGFMDFGSVQTKRLDSVYVGYTSDGDLQLTAETYESGHPQSVYLFDARTAAAPRNNRALFGKGMYGRYWRLTFRNVDGSDFEVHDAFVDIAVSTRRL